MDTRIVAGGQFPGDRSVLSDCREARGSKMFPAKGGGARSVPGGGGDGGKVWLLGEGVVLFAVEGRSG